jgi:hypothetical protein
MRIWRYYIFGLACLLRVLAFFVCLNLILLPFISFINTVNDEKSSVILVVFMMVILVVFTPLLAAFVCLKCGQFIAPYKSVPFDERPGQR